ncbi:hypothetical protein AVEN_145000-1 [Araneus ventricosus]|uniref:Uncharacterized protein n=1 Tax=Araneus ventricosus TaxID=182803 RepID=A0A4Y2N023_ARAVE|nr:hypothetical protein AVEN_145000-1 [Araneus ventricosus]
MVGRVQRMLECRGPLGGRTLLARDWPGTSLSDARLDLGRFDCAFFVSSPRGLPQGEAIAGLGGKLLQAKEDLHPVIDFSPL